MCQSSGIFGNCGCWEFSTCPRIRYRWDAIQNKNSLYLIPNAVVYPGQILEATWKTFENSWNIPREYPWKTPWKTPWEIPGKLFGRKFLGKLLENSLGTSLENFLKTPWEIPWKTPWGKPGEFLGNSLEIPWKTSGKFFRKLLENSSLTVAN